MSGAFGGGGADIRGINIVYYLALKPVHIVHDIVPCTSVPSFHFMVAG